MVFGYARELSSENVIAKTLDVMNYCVYNNLRITRMVVDTTNNLSEFYSDLLNKISIKDTLIVTNLKELGNSLPQILENCSKLFERGVTIQVTSLGSTSQSIQQFTELLLQTQKELMLDKKENCKKEGKSFGRPKTTSAIKFEKAYKIYKEGKIEEAIQASGLSKATFYRRLKEYNYTLLKSN